MNNVRHTRGFTLIELVVVIVILGILAAFAIPRFVDLQKEARYGALKGMEGSIRAAAALAHAKSLVSSAGPTDSISMEGATITMVNHYPTADAAGIVKALQDTSGFAASGGGAGAGATLTLTSNGGAATCKVDYTAPASDGVAPAVVPGAGDASGC
jgi:MSHA pilin protein MshA